MTAVECFAVPPGDDDGFLEAWTAEGGGGVLLRALRDDAAHRFVAIDWDAGDRGGVWRLAWLDAEPGDPPEGRQGFLGARVLRDGDGCVEVQRWSSPLMVQRAGLVAGATLYARVE